MKTAGLFLLFLLLGAGLTFFYLTANTKKEATKPKKILPVKTSKFSLENAPTQSLKGNISSLSGKVKWLSRTATKSASITKPQKIQQGELIQTGDDGKVSIIFSNISLKQANNTELEFLQTIPSDFVVSQPSGSVEYIDQSKNTPLSIRSMHLLIRLPLGKILVTADDEEKQITVDIIEGEVTVAFNDTDNVTQTLTLPQNERLIFDEDKRTLRKKSLAL